MHELGLSDNGKEVIDEAHFLAASSEARGLPGFRGTISQEHPMTAAKTKSTGFRLPILQGVLPIKGAQVPTELVAGLVGLAATGSDEYLALCALLAFMAAGFLILARIIGLGFLADFLSRTVLVGFLTGVGIQVALGEISGMLGLKGGGHGHPGEDLELISSRSSRSTSTRWSSRSACWWSSSVLRRSRTRYRGH